jgi:hypothetical protein
MALEALVRGGPFDRACFYAADGVSGTFRPRTGLGDGVDGLLQAPGIPFAGSAGPTGAALLRGEEAVLAHGTRLTLPELQLLRRWDTVNAVLVPVRADAVVIGCLHADRRTTFTAPDASVMAYVRGVVRSLERAVALRRGGAGGAAPAPFPGTPAAAAAPAPGDDVPPAPAPAAPAPAAADGAEADVGPQRKVDAVLRLLRGEPPAEVARSLAIDEATLGRWRAAFLAGAAARLGA